MLFSVLRHYSREAVRFACPHVWLKEWCDFPRLHVRLHNKSISKHLTDVMTTRHTVTFLSREEARPSLNLEDYYDIDRQYAKPGFKTPSGALNWHCSCVSAYVTGPCGYFFRNFMKNIDRFLKNDNAFESEENRSLFKRIHYELMGCLKAHPVYYKSFIDEYSSPLENLMNDAV
ncbi:hypothetical protein CRM22_001873 [Opisthorchis felineus]|uniref:Uncharacterized protein n=1 Tax=Opisthorchis felineus TaxID=147828 RepID=A0A4S2M8J2_OPIFE|nr:hypothetical protein CRM22_001873 [Opisthorchis felineus]